MHEAPTTGNAGGEGGSTRPEPIDVRAILESRSLDSHYQPIVSTKDAKIVGLEALARPRVPGSGSPISPLRFFAEAAAQGLALDADRFCRRRGIEGFVKYFSSYPELLIFINLDASILNASTLGSNCFVDLVRGCALAPENVVIEILESAVDDEATLLRFVESHREQGFLIALDDMGAGSSNLERIPLLKPDIIKLDHSLIRGIDSEYYKQELYDFFLKLTSKFGTLVIAEGIETREEVLTCMERGGDLMQGYYFAHPSEPSEEMMSSCLEEATGTALAYRVYEGERISERRRVADYCNDIAERVSREMRSRRFPDLDEALRKSIRRYPDVECAYVLDGRGIQLSSTVFNPSRSLQPGKSLFHPAPRGCDQRSKDYFLSIDTRRTRYFSEPYVSKASGRTCITISTARLARGEVEEILCLDISTAPTGSDLD
jgi:EAL domain-containing protein (putative c-di-GMP-specific phosphodiesterase class I)